ncbi:transposase [Aneurinibacillus sp. BA2021]|nr:transposase [Aneurinibacillus sp. BA2021]
MKRLKITETHGWTVRDLRKQERKMKDVALRQRVMAVRLVMEGYLGKEVAAMLNLHRQFIATYVSTFNAGGLDAVLERKFPPGKEAYLNEQQREELKQLIVESTPADQGISMYTSWDTRIIQMFLQEKYGVSMSRGGITGMLRRMGLSYTRPTYTLAKADKKKQEAFVNQMNLIKKPFDRRYGASL